MSPDTPESFGAFLRRWRRSAGLSQPALAKAAGNICTSAYISALERGADKTKGGRPTRPGEDVVEALAKALGVPVNVARKAAGYSALHSEMDMDDDSQAMIAILLELPNATRDDLLAIAQALHRRHAHSRSGQTQAQQRSDKRLNQATTPPDNIPKDPHSDEEYRKLESSAVLASLDPLSILKKGR